MGNDALALVVGPSPVPYNDLGIGIAAVYSFFNGLVQGFDVAGILDTVFLCQSVDSLSLFKACCESAGVLEGGDKINDLYVLDLRKLSVKLVCIDAVIANGKTYSLSTAGAESVESTDKCGSRSGGWS